MLLLPLPKIFSIFYQSNPSICTVWKHVFPLILPLLPQPSYIPPDSLLSRPCMHDGLLFSSQRPWSHVYYGCYTFKFTDMCIFLFYKIVVLAFMFLRKHFFGMCIYLGCQMICILFAVTFYVKKVSYPSYEMNGIHSNVLHLTHFLNIRPLNINDLFSRYC